MIDYKNEFNKIFTEDTEKDTTLNLQIKFCINNNVDMFAPISGKCLYCGNVIEDTDQYLITGCHNCNRSFVE